MEDTHVEELVAEATSILQNGELRAAAIPDDRMRNGVRAPQLRQNERDDARRQADDKIEAEAYQARTNGVGELEILRGADIPARELAFGAKYRDLIQMAADLDAGLVVYAPTQGSPALTSNEVSLDGFAVTKAQLRYPGWKATNKVAYDKAVKTRTLRVVD